jgi:hypothetical protein
VAGSRGFCLVADLNDSQNQDVSTMHHDLQTSQHKICKLSDVPVQYSNIHINKQKKTFFSDGSTSHTLLCAITCKQRSKLKKSKNQQLALAIFTWRLM